MFYRQVAEHLKTSDLALASIVEASGSAPRGIGAKMLVLPGGKTAGTIGGGAVEHAAIQLASKALEEGRSSLQQYNLSASQVSDLGMICGGNITVYIQHLPAGDREGLALYRAIQACVDSNSPCALVTAIEGEESRCYLAASNTPAPLPPELGDLDLSSLHVEKRGEALLVVEPLVEGRRLLVFGAGHVGQELTQLARWLGFYTVALDDRAFFLTQETLPMANERKLVDFAAAFEGLGAGEGDFVVIMTRGHQNDYQVLRQALATPARYIGMIGSRGKVAATLERLGAEGVSPQDIARVHAPIGVPLGGKTPREIAVSVAAQLIRARNGYREE